MLKEDIPQINTTLSTSNAYSGSDLMYCPGQAAWGPNVGHASSNAIWGGSYSKEIEAKLKGFAEQDELLTLKLNAQAALEKRAKEKAKMSDSRVVQVYIVDTDKNLPVEKRLIYKGEQIFTDLSDQDLFFDIELKPLLAKHNELRATLTDKKKSSATEKVYLEPVRVSDLKMTVAVLAEF